jgi:uncharacterized protein (DUF1697 family)
MPPRATAHSRHIALLRGINVAGKNKLPMKDLVALVIALGGREVRTHIQSGNVVFDATVALAGRMPTLLRDAIAERLGLAIPVVLRTAAELQAVVQTNPFLTTGADPQHLHVAFLADAPSPTQIAALDPDRSPPDAFVVRGREVYLCLPNGVGRSKLTNAYLDAKLATTSTVRNWRTVLALVELAGPR